MKWEGQNGLQDGVGWFLSWKSETAHDDKEIIVVLASNSVHNIYYAA